MSFWILGWKASPFVHGSGGRKVNSELGNARNDWPFKTTSDMYLEKHFQESMVVEGFTFQGNQLPSLKLTVCP